jgi:hypothetical protein
MATTRGASPLVWTECLRVGYDATMACLSRGGLIVLLSLASASFACDRRKLTEVTVPDEGVALAYDLSQGKTFSGHIRVSNTLGSPVGDIYNAVEFDVALTVDATQGTRTLMRARVTHVKVDSRLPEGVPPMAGLTQKAANAVEGMEVRFHLDARGDVTDPPVPPADAPLDVKAVIALVGTGLKGSFARLPEGPVRAGDTWDTAPAEAPTDGTAQGTGTLAGLAEDAASGERVARLEYTSKTERTAEAEGESVTGTFSGSATALFAVSGYAVNVERRLTGEAKGMSLNVEIFARWAPAGS